MSGSKENFWKLPNLFRGIVNPARGDFYSQLDPFGPFEEVNNARLHELVKVAVEDWLMPQGFEAAGTLKWVRDRCSPIRHAFGFAKWKGGKVAPRWGVSLDFVPHFSGQQIRWHRSNKSAEFDLCVDARTRALDMSYIRGARHIIDMHRQVIAGVRPQAEDFWKRCETFDQLPEAIAWLKDRLSDGGLGFYNYTQHPLAAAFVLAKSGHLSEALTELENSHVSTFRNETAIHKLKKLLAAED